MHRKLISLARHHELRLWNPCKVAPKFLSVGVLFHQELTSMEGIKASLGVRLYEGSQGTSTAQENHTEIRPVSKSDDTSS